MFVGRGLDPIVAGIRGQAKPPTGGATALFAVLLPLKYLLIGGLMFLLIRGGHLSLFWFVVGFLITQVSVTVATVLHLAKTAALVTGRDSALQLQDWTVYLINGIAAALVLLILGLYAAGRRNVKRPGRLQGFFEWSIAGLSDLFRGALGPNAEQHLPLVLALFFYVLFTQPGRPDSRASPAIKPDGSWRSRTSSPRPPRPARPSRWP